MFVFFFTFVSYYWNSHYKNHTYYSLIIINHNYSHQVDFKQNIFWKLIWVAIWKIIQFTTCKAWNWLRYIGETILKKRKLSSFDINAWFEFDLLRLNSTFSCAPLPPFHFFEIGLLSFSSWKPLSLNLKLLLSLCHLSFLSISFRLYISWKVRPKGNFLLTVCVNIILFFLPFFKEIQLNYAWLEKERKLDYRLLNLWILTV